MTQPQNRRLHLTLGPAEVHEGWQGEVDVADEQNGLIKAVRDIGWAVPAAAQAKREIFSGDRKGVMEGQTDVMRILRMLHMCEDNRMHFFLYQTATKKKLGNTWTAKSTWLSKDYVSLRGAKP